MVMPLMEELKSPEGSGQHPEISSSRKAAVTKGEDEISRVRSCWHQGKLNPQQAVQQDLKPRGDARDQA